MLDSPLGAWPDQRWTLDAAGGDCTEAAFGHYFQLPCQRHKGPPPSSLQVASFNLALELTASVGRDRAARQPAQRARGRPERRCGCAERSGQQGMPSSPLESSAPTWPGGLPRAVTVGASGTSGSLGMYKADPRPPARPAGLVAGLPHYYHCSIVNLRLSRYLGIRNSFVATK